MTWLTFMEDNTVKFESVMEPLLKLFINLESKSNEMLRAHAVKNDLIGLMRDLRGIIMAMDSCRTGSNQWIRRRETYKRLFDLLHPDHLYFLLNVISIWADTPEVTTQLLKFMAAFVLNKGGRLSFDSDTSSGILLFNVVNQLVVSYGTKILSLREVPGDVYAYKYKGTWICLTILSQADKGLLWTVGNSFWYLHFCGVESGHRGLHAYRSFPRVRCQRFRYNYFITVCICH